MFAIAIRAMPCFHCHVTLPLIMPLLSCRHAAVDIAMIFCLRYMLRHAITAPLAYAIITASR